MRPSSESNQRAWYGHSPPKVQSIAFLLHRGNPPAALDLALQFPLTSLPMPRIEPRVPGLSRRPSIDGSVSAGPSSLSRKLVDRAALRQVRFVPPTSLNEREANGTQESRSRRSQVLVSEGAAFSSARRVVRPDGPPQLGGRSVRTHMGLHRGRRAHRRGVPRHHALLQRALRAASPVHPPAAARRPGGARWGGCYGGGLATAAQRGGLVARPACQR